MAKTIFDSLPDMSKARDRVKKPELIFDDVLVSPRLASYGKGRKFIIKTFGCQANVRDEEILSGYLEKAGMVRTDNENEAGMVIINTCAVRENAEDKVYGEIGNYKKRAKEDPSFSLAICGCMMQEEGVAEKLIKSYPYISVIFGTHNIHKILELLDWHLKTNKTIVSILSFAGDIIENLPSDRVDKHQAFVNITYGCDKFCTYCIVPYTRGRERSRPLDVILKECKELVDAGYAQITLLGQNVNSYGKDFKDGTSFATCLEAVAKLGIPRLRFMTSHPWDFSDEMLDVIARYPNIMKCIHLPVQSGSSEVLKLMGRRYSREQYLDLVKRIKAKIPGVALTTDIIVGFPNETAEQFEDTMTLCEEVRYDSAFTFIYSPRKGTPAAKMVDNVDDKTKHERFDRLLKIIEETTNEASAKLVGQTVPVLVSGPSKKNPEILSGYTEGSKLVNFKGPAYLEGEIVDLKIVENHCHYVVGELLEDPLLIKARSLKKALNKEKAVAEFLSLEKQIEEDEELVSLRKEIQSAQKKMTASMNGDDSSYIKAKEAYLSLKKRYEEHPLVKNHEALHDEVEAILLEVKEALK